MNTTNEIIEEISQFNNKPKKKKRNTWIPNDVLIHQDRVEIILRNNKQKINGIVTIDLPDLNVIKNHKWSLSSGYARTVISSRTVRMHTLIMNPPKGKMIDHLNHNGLDNRRHNLKIVTNQENMKNNSTTQEPRIFYVD
jgi:hypothetical protein